MEERETVTYTPSGRKLTKKNSGTADAQESARVAELEDAAQAEYGIRVNFRWGKEQLDLVKAVADQMGVPYQTYMKMAIMKQCMNDALALHYGAATLADGGAIHSVLNQSLRHQCNEWSGKTQIFLGATTAGPAARYLSLQPGLLKGLSY